MSKTLFRKIWDQHLVADGGDGPSLLWIDLHLVHEVTSPRRLKDCGWPAAPFAVPT